MIPVVLHVVGGFKEERKEKKKRGRVRGAHDNRSLGSK